MTLRKRESIRQKRIENKDRQRQETLGNKKIVPVKSKTVVKNNSSNPIDINENDDEIHVKIVSNEIDLSFDDNLLVLNNKESSSLGKIEENRFYEVECMSDEPMQVSNFYDTLITSEDKGVQVEFEKYKNFIKNEKDLRIMTGLENLSILNMLEDIVRVGLPKTEFKSMKTSSLTIKDQLVLTFMKLKNDVGCSFLSTLFEIESKETCKQIFLKMIDTLSSSFIQSTNRWPNKEELMRSVPKNFQNSDNVEVTVDRMKIFVEKPKKFCNRSSSLNKSIYIVKFMTDSSKNGYITFKSKGYFEKFSDDRLFEQSPSIEIKNDNDILTEKGVLIDEICIHKDIRSIKSLELVKEKEKLLKIKIAKAQKHVERLNKYLEFFKILRAPLPPYFDNREDKIFLIICAVLNLSLPLLKNYQSDKKN